jgi:nucleoside-diphosphate-sugar epimerase
MTYLLTGSTGFLGNYILKALEKKGKCYTLGRRCAEVDFRCDIACEIPDFGSHSIDIIIHNAGKAHSIPKSDAEKEEFFKINHQGTKNLLEGLSKLSSRPKLLVLISTVAVYGRDSGDLIRESEPLLGATPYSMSKIKAEEEIQKWGTSFAVNCLILRLPLIVGFDRPVGNLKSLIAGIKKGYYFRPGKGKAKKSMVWAEDIADLVANLSPESKGIVNLTDGVNPSLAELDTAIGTILGTSIKQIPEGLLRIMAKWGDLLPFFPFDSLKFEKLTFDLTFSSEKASKELGWNPKSVVEQIKNFGQKIK